MLSGLAEGHRITDQRRYTERARDARPDDSALDGATAMTAVASPTMTLRARHFSEVETAVTLAYDEYAESLKGFASAAVRDRDLAEDLVQETFVRLVRELQAGRTIDNLRGWLFRVCTNLSVSHGRRQSVRDRLRGSLIVRGAAPSPEEYTIRRDEDADLRRALDCIRAEERIVLLLSAAGLSAAEIGVATNRSANATRVFICRARMHLREVLSIQDTTDR